MPCDEACKLYDDSRHFYQAYQVIIALKCMHIFAQWFEFINNHEPLGVLIIMIKEMVKDVVLFLYLFAVVTGAFMVAGAALQSAALYAHDVNGTSSMEGRAGGAFSAEGNFWSPMWMMFGFFEPSYYSWVSAPLGWIYSFICCIGMVNLLVAMFADTFTRVKGSSEVEFRYVECERMVKYRDVVLSAPPLINLPYIIYVTFHRCQQLCDSYCASRAARAALVLKTATSLEIAAAKKKSKKGSVVRMGAVSVKMLRKPSLEIEAEDAEESRPSKATKSSSSFDGKNLVSMYIKQQDKLASDDPQAIAASIRDNFAGLFKQREEEFLATKRLFSQLESTVEALNRKVDFPRGARLSHEKHGLGTVTDHLPDDRIVIMFDKHEEHKSYRPSSLQKLTLVKVGTLA